MCSLFEISSSTKIKRAKNCIKYLPSNYLYNPKITCIRLVPVNLISDLSI